MVFTPALISAVSPGFSYDGEKHGEVWKRKIRGYWISKCPEILPVLNYARDMYDLREFKRAAFVLKPYLSTGN